MRKNKMRKIMQSKKKSIQNHIILQTKKKNYKTFYNSKQNDRECGASTHWKSFNYFDDERIFERIITSIPREEY